MFSACPANGEAEQSQRAEGVSANEGRFSTGLGGILCPFIRFENDDNFDEFPFGRIGIHH